MTAIWVNGSRLHAARKWRAEMACTLAVHGFESNQMYRLRTIGRIAVGVILPILAMSLVVFGIDWMGNHPMLLLVVGAALCAFMLGYGRGKTSGYNDARRFYAENPQALPRIANGLEEPQGYAKSAHLLPPTLDDANFRLCQVEAELSKARRRWGVLAVLASVPISVFIGAFFVPQSYFGVCIGLSVCGCCLIPLLHRFEYRPRIGDCQTLRLLLPHLRYHVGILRAPILKAEQEAQDRRFARIIEEVAQEERRKQRRPSS